MVCPTCMQPLEPALPGKRQRADSAGDPNNPLTPYNPDLLPPGFDRNFFYAVCVGLPVPLAAFLTVFDASVTRRGLDQSAKDTYKHAAQMLNNLLYDQKKAAIINKPVPTLPVVTSNLELMIAFGNLLAVRANAFEGRTAVQDELFAKLLRQWMAKPNFSVTTFVLALDSHAKSFCEMFGASDPAFRLFPLEDRGFDTDSLITFFPPAVQVYTPPAQLPPQSTPAPKPQLPPPNSGPADDTVAWRSMSASCRANGLCPNFNHRTSGCKRACGKRHGCGSCGADGHAIFDCKKHTKKFLQSEKRDSR
jgi:hypothetical protein